MSPVSLARRGFPFPAWFPVRSVYHAWVERACAVWHRRLVRRIGGRVLSGPFRGMRYVHEAVGSSYLPKLLGTYELELHPVVDKLRGMGFGLVVDVGAAEGYYAVGAALLWPSARVVAFEAEATGRLLCGELAARNGARARVEVLGFADLRSFGGVLDRAGGAPTLVIMDVEGAEVALLDPAATPALARATILVECHDDEGNPIAETLRARFGATHSVETYASRRRTLADFPLRDRPPLGWSVPVMAAMAEHRPRRMEWLFMTPRGRVAENPSG